MSKMYRCVNRVGALVEAVLLFLLVSLQMTGYSTITDGRGYPHNVYISAKRDGSIWLRVGQDHKAEDWIYQNESQRRFLVTLLEPSEVDMLQNMPYVDQCVLTDLKLNIHAYASWHPSFIQAYDPATRLPVIMVFRIGPGVRQRCRTNTSLTLTEEGQGLTCHGGPVNSCGYRGVINKDQISQTLFLKYLQFYPHGSADAWKCLEGPSSSSYTFLGSHYHAYVKIASCKAPIDSREFGHEAKLRPLCDTGSDMVVIPDPQQTALANGFIKGWQVFAKIISMNHNVYLQKVWRPSRDNAYSFTLVGQTYFEPNELRFQQINLHSSEYIYIKKGDVLGFYIPDQSPLAWSPVPCAYPAQQTLVLNRPPSLKTGINLQFKDSFYTHSEDIRYACRHYSFTALMGNKTTAKRIEDWICPTTPSSEGNILWRSADTPEGNTATIISVDNVIHTGNRETIRPASDNLSHLQQAVPMYIIVIITAALFLLFLFIGVFSYYKASTL